MEYSYILLLIYYFSLSVSFISTHPLNPLRKMKNLKKHNPDCMQAQRHLVQCINKYSVVTSKVHWFMLEEIDVAKFCV